MRSEFAKTTIPLFVQIVAGMILVLAGNVFILRGVKPNGRVVYSQPDNQRPLRLAAERLR